MHMLICISIFPNLISVCYETLRFNNLQVQETPEYPARDYPASVLSGLFFVNVLFMFPAFKLGITEFMLKYEQFIFFNLLFL
jgi:hypothetical protein